MFILNYETNNNKLYVFCIKTIPLNNNENRENY